ncbi:MAG: helix-turn-helix domain-containing protein [Clostridia bacterium]|nr:helix-turn-helix domain-containing protein [Clostridia bacterium]
MKELDRISQNITEQLSVPFAYYREDSIETDVPVCDRQFDDMTDDGEHVFFRFSYKQNGYVGVLFSVTEEVKRYALLLPAYIESFSEKEANLTKSEYLKKILLGECTSKAIATFENKFSVSGFECFVLVLRVQKLMEETLGLIAQYAGNSLDAVVRIDSERCAFVKFLKADEQEYHSSADYAEFLVQSLKEELGLDVVVGVGSTVKSIKDASLSYAQASSALRYATVFSDKGSVHTYREYMLVKMLEDASESKLVQYLSELMDEGSREILEDEEMVATAEEFLRCSLNVSETSRNLYMHRNTLLYRLDKIEKATGLNIRLFPDAVSFRVLTILYKLLDQ